MKSIIEKYHRRVLILPKVVQDAHPHIFVESAIIEAGSQCFSNLKFKK